MKAVIFDLDGTLLDTLRDLADSVNCGLKNLGFPVHPVEAYRYFVGDGREKMALRALPEDHRDPLTLGRLIQFINEDYALRWVDHTRPYPGIPEMLDKLTRSGIRLAILSNKPQDFTGLMVARLLAAWYFEIVAGACPGIPLKPDCTAALDIARRMDIMPDEFLYLGDSDIDMKTAKAAGMYPVGALWGFRTAGELKSGGAKSLLSHPMELLELL